MYNKKIPKIKKDWNLWKKGLYNLKELSLGEPFFTAVYGAEPLLDFDYLPEYFEYITQLGFYHTLITNCLAPDIKFKLEELVKFGLNSLTVSFDGNVNDQDINRSSKLKTDKGLDTILWYEM
jgi:MoaA/NifB/PqqE/SkfB family radical SAM enzyme